MDKTAGIITELLPQAEAEALREFLQHYAANHTEFAVDFGQWLMRKYARHANNADIYVAEVKRLFLLTEEKYHGYNRNRYYMDDGLNWYSINEGMVRIAATLQQKLADGCHQAVTAPVVEFYRQLAQHLDEFLMEDEPYIYSAPEACDKLLLEWAECPAVPLQEKQALYQTLQELAKTEIMRYINGLSTDFFLKFLTLIQSPQEVLATIEKLAAKGSVPSTLVHKHIALLRQFGREQEALQVIRRNLNHFSVLDEELDRLYECGADYAALNLLDLVPMGCNMEYFIKEKRIRFLERLGDTKALIDIYRYLLLSYRGSLHHFHKLKALVPPAEWPAQYKLIVKEGKAAKRDVHAMAEIYAAEGDYEALSQAIMSMNYDILTELLRYLPQMPEQYHAPLLQKGCESLEQEAHRADKRSEYARVAANIRRFATLPQAQPLADALVARLRTTFARRPAYLEELGKV